IGRRPGRIDGVRGEAQLARGTSIVAGGAAVRPGPHHQARATARSASVLQLHKRVEDALRHAHNVEPTGYEDDRPANLLDARAEVDRGPEAVVARVLLDLKQCLARIAVVQEPSLSEPLAPHALLEEGIMVGASGARGDVLTDDPLGTGAGEQQLVGP